MHNAHVILYYWTKLCTESWNVRQNRIDYMAACEELLTGPGIA